MKILFISDTHRLHEKVEIPKNVDCIIHCGDEANSAQEHWNEDESRQFFKWYSDLPVDKKIFVPGNHSTAISHGLIKPEHFPDIEFLIHEETSIGPYSVFGSPYTPEYGKSWAYMKKRNRMKIVWESVPDVDILLTHGPPKGILDLTHDRDKRSQVVQVGCKSLRNRVEDMKPILHVFGHVHDEEGCSNHGTFCGGDTRFINAACSILGTSDVEQGIMVELEGDK
jgi:Icc-related predicted phosphoesterase